VGFVTQLPYNNCHVAETVKALLEGGPVSVKSFVLEETHLFLKVISDEIVDRDSGLKAGVMIGNSEVGTASISIEPFVYLYSAKIRVWPEPFLVNGHALYSSRRRWEVASISTQSSSV